MLNITVETPYGPIFSINSNVGRSIIIFFVIVKKNYHTESFSYVDDSANMCYKTTTLIFIQLSMYERHTF